MYNTIKNNKLIKEPQFIPSMNEKVSLWSLYELIFKDEWNLLNKDGSYMVRESQRFCGLFV